jgi:hypothetical protein
MQAILPSAILEWAGASNPNSLVNLKTSEALGMK